jgi:pyrroloquinoline-quinone synthase
MARLWTEDEFVARLRAVGANSYHDKHPFHQHMNRGELARENIRSWVINRFYYQRNIPLKDAAILSRCPIQAVRRIWLHRIVDHDGLHDCDGGIEAWLRLGEACDISRGKMLDDGVVLPGVRAAVNKYVEFARTKAWQISVAASLTELFAPDLMRQRLSAFEQYYRWINPAGLEYFRNRLTQASKDSDEALALTLKYCDNDELQRAAIDALVFKCDVLWQILESISSENANSAGEFLNSIPKLATRARLQSDRVTGEPVLLFPEGAASINSSAEAALKLCNGKRTVSAIVDFLQQEFQGDRAEILMDVRTTLDELRKRRLVEFLEPELHTSSKGSKHENE